jgi:transcription-repair coupling factor (superfamily II helicase)
MPEHEIRGVGDILGRPRGAMSGQRYELYQEMLKDAVDGLRVCRPRRYRPRDHSVWMRTYRGLLPVQHLRLGLYRRLSAHPLTTAAVATELEDLYGPPLSL